MGWRELQKPAFFGTKGGERKKNVAKRLDSGFMGG